MHTKRLFYDACIAARSIIYLEDHGNNTTVDQKNFTKTDLSVATAPLPLLPGPCRSVALPKPFKTPYGHWGDGYEREIIYD